MFKCVGYVSVSMQAEDSNTQIPPCLSREFIRLLQGSGPVRTDSGLVWDFPAVAGKYMARSGKQMWPV